MPKLPKAKVFTVTAEINEADHLVIGGADVLELAQEYGTPLYVYDEATLLSAANAFKSAFESRYSDSIVA